jgi:hypothetical protein
MRATPALFRLASTKNGMRRMLKRPIPTVEFIRQAIQTGVYLGPDEDRANIQRRNRMQQYPIEYQILALNPPVPLPPRIPKKLLRQMALQEKKKTKTDRLVQSYLNKQSAEQKQESHDATDEKTVDDYYRHLLGIAAPAPTSVMGQKSSLLNKAYVVALKQQELMRTSSDMTQDESLALVEELLAEQSKEERHTSRNVQTKVKDWKEWKTKTNQIKKDKKTRTAAASASASTLDEDSGVDSPSIDNEDDASETMASSTPSVLHSKPRAIRGISLWSKRLQAVPYREWTIGASVALDHFVARSILEVTEDTWEALLEGSSPSLKSIGQDIVLTRRSLFPETAMAELEIEAEGADMEGELDEDDEEDEKASSDKSIDELLAKLGGFDDEDDDVDDFIWKNEPGENDMDSKVARLSDELQEWRQKQHSEANFAEWSFEDKAKFDEWLKDYVNTLQPDSTLESIDLVETRDALLAAPPMTREESSNFWNSIRDETEAELFLQSLQQDDTATTGASPFWTLDYRTQVERLAAIGGSLRPLLDENVDTATRMAFMERHSDKLLEGLELEHLVKDDVNGVVTGADLRKFSSNPELSAGVADTDRFSIQTLPYGTNERALALFQEWNHHKVGRARYEENLFSSGKLGLRYTDEIKEENDDEDD